MNQVQRTFPIIPEVSRSVQNEFRTLRQMVYDQQDALGAATQIIQNLKQGNTIVNQNVSSTTENVTVAGGTGGTGGTVVTNTTGGNPNVTQLLGILAQAQRSFIPEYSSLPVLQDPASQNGSLISVNGILYRFNGDTQPGQWEPQAAIAAVIEDTHAHRVANYPPASNPIGTVFYETDSTLVLVNSGTQWLTVAGEIRGTHANRLSSWPSVQFSVNTPFYETDRTSFYVVKDATGTVTVTGGVNVAWASGSHFINTGSGFTAAQWPAGTPITIGGVVCHVATVASPTSLTLQAPTANGAGVPYSVSGGVWEWSSGTYSDTNGNIPVDLGENDYQSATAGFQFFDTTHWRLFQWAPTGGGPSSTSPGWQRGEGEMPTGYVSILPFGPGQMTTGWSLCNGLAVSITQDDATTTNVTKPNLIGGYPKGGTTGTYSPTQNPAVTPTVTGGVTDDTFIGFTPAAAAASATATPVTVQSGTGATVNSLVSGGGGGGGGALNTDPHHHTLSSVSISLPGDPVANVVVPFYMKR